jgi:hypothetical protein
MSGSERARRISICLKKEEIYLLYDVFSILPEDNKKQNSLEN